MSAPIILADMLARLDATVAINAHKHRVMVAMLDALRPFEGKQITKRLATAVQKALPEYTVYYDAEYSWIKLKIWGNGLEYNSNVDVILTYTGTGNDGIYHHENMVRVPDSNDYKVRMGYAYPYLRLALDLTALRPELPVLVARYNSALAALDMASSAFGAAGYLTQPKDR